MRNHAGRFSAGIPPKRAATDSIRCAAATKQPNVRFGGSQGSAAQAKGSSCELALHDSPAELRRYLKLYSPGYREPEEHVMVIPR